MNKPGFLTVAAKLVLNVHDLNNEGSIGQTTDIRTIRMVDENGKEIGEVPAVSGRMLKHWHLAYMLREELESGPPKLCAQCKVWEPERKPQDETAGINACVICDAHGFLCTDKPGFTVAIAVSNDTITLKKEARDDEPEETFNVLFCEHAKENMDKNCPTCAVRQLDGKRARVSGELSTDEEGKKTIKVTFVQEIGRGKDKIKVGSDPKGLSLRRSSCINFSWLLPVLTADSTAKQVIHSRVASSGGEGEDTSQMIFYKSYASSIYGFVCSIDLNRIGKPLVGNTTLADEEIKRRRQMAVRALLPMVTGAFGASQSHALPHTKCLGVIAALSDNITPLPNLVSPIYSNGFGESVIMLKAFGNTNVKYWGYGEPPVDVANKKPDPQNLFKTILDELK
jgi:CRISPR-associated autoregulator DevR family